MRRPHRPGRRARGGFGGRVRTGGRYVSGAGADDGIIRVFCGGGGPCRGGGPDGLAPGGGIGRPWGGGAGRRPGWAVQPGPPPRRGGGAPLPGGGPAGPRRSPFIRPCTVPSVSRLAPCAPLEAMLAPQAPLGESPVRSGRGPR
ncbi:hypothetical protein GCM10017577_27400 [Pseudonocardia halophobica]|uniref:Uncharacterized protein n=1 Tax=Pseudonocardia halophobica TaxID=29401 RepID=A0A9W6L3J2_9PSEU|nr:hypothetical protein GCM10017577_27400 [Pseudonocardia halophobica]